mmetsp:Transcript_41205/g.96254  ORF Transcript_41205/g.96254 Transcript_41205/m.96254 type:complete len:202 (+) Transcript_41205:340-945(+)
MSSCSSLLSRHSATDVRGEARLRSIRTSHSVIDCHVNLRSLTSLHSHLGLTISSSVGDSTAELMHASCWNLIPFLLCMNLRSLTSLHFHLRLTICISPVDLDTFSQWTDRGDSELIRAGVTIANGGFNLAVCWNLSPLLLCMSVMAPTRLCFCRVDAKSLARARIFCMKAVKVLDVVFPSVPQTAPINASQNAQQEDGNRN